MQRLTFLKYPTVSNLGAAVAGHFWQFYPIPMSLKFNSHQFAFCNELKRTTTSCEKKILAIDALLIRYYVFLFFFTELAPLGRFSHRVALSRCLSVCLCLSIWTPKTIFLNILQTFFCTQKMYTPIIFLDPLKKNVCETQKKNILKKNDGPLKRNFGPEKRR